MRRAMTCARLRTRLKHWRRAKKRGVWQIARLKQQRFLSFIFCETPRSYEKIMCIYLLFH